MVLPNSHPHPHTEERVQKKMSGITAPQRKTNLDFRNGRVTCSTSAPYTTNIMQEKATENKNKTKRGGGSPPLSYTKTYEKNNLEGRQTN